MRILVVEDDRVLCDMIAYWLRAHQYNVDECHDGEEAEYYRTEGSYDCILLDRMLPGPDGISILKKMRAAGDATPVIMITALGALSDKLTGLDGGADDYLVKPFELEELEARIRSVTRRRSGAGADRTLRFRDVVYQPDGLKLSGPGGLAVLSRKEGLVMETLLQNAEKTLSRETILTKVWGIDSDVEATNLDNYIHFLRKRLKSLKCSVKIANVWGVGYRMEGDA